jgi:predicted alpha-1,2-mannosidase
MRLLRRAILILLSILFILVAALLGTAIYYYKTAHTGAAKLSTVLQPGERGALVNPFSGTGGYPWMCAYNHPGAQTPYGMVRLSPETASILLNKKGFSTAGYFYGDNKIIGFSHTRLNGTGAADGGHFLIVPAIGDKAVKNYRDEKYYRFSHARETAFPGYYAVDFHKRGILAELTATPRVGVHRYTFRKNHEPHILFDISHAIGDGRSKDATVKIVKEDNEIVGSVRTFGSFSRRYGGLKAWFVARFDTPFDAAHIWSGDSLIVASSGAGDNLCVDASFQKKVVQLKLAISYVSLENAHLNLEAEAADKSFDEIVSQTKSAWEEKLELISVKGGTEEQHRIFNTALYRTFQMPTMFQDVNGEYLGFDKQIHSAEGFRYFTDMSLWDTFRTTHPLYTLIAPQDQRDMLVSLVQMAEQGGSLPRWPSGGGYTNSMLSSPADVVVGESWLKGIHNFDVETAYSAARAVATGPLTKESAASGRRGIEDYLKYGYCPSDRMKQAVSRTLEYGWSDYSLALLAEVLGKTDDAVMLKEQSQFYRNLWNPETNYFQPKNSNGEFNNFDPLLLTYLDRKGELTNDYVEGSALQWRWGPFFDAQGLLSLFEDRDFFISELDDFFEKANDRLGWWHPGSYYWHGNQPDIHAAYLFNAAGRPDLAQKWVRWILETKHGDNFIGLDGNDDGGTLSAWYIFSSLGFYPVAGTDIYQLGAPLFKHAEIKMGDKILQIIADNYAPDHIYANRVWLNEKLLDRWWIKHDEIAEGGMLRFEMSDKPIR